MENATKDKEKQDYSHIEGWGIDADPKNDPTYPMRKREKDDHSGYSWERPPQQPIDIEVLHSIERPNVTAVFGTSKPPHGLSGKLRRFAFKYGEGSFNHWLPLIMADRVDVVEGILDDLKKGHIPNIFEERGMKAEWKYNRKGLLQRVALTTAFATAAIMLLARR